jgi:hypothetical protein
MQGYVSNKALQNYASKNFLKVQDNLILQRNVDEKITKKRRA